MDPMERFKETNCKRCRGCEGYSVEHSPMKIIYQRYMCIREFYGFGPLIPWVFSDYMMGDYEFLEFHKTNCVMCKYEQACESHESFPCLFAHFAAKQRQQESISYISDKVRESAVSTADR